MWSYSFDEWKPVIRRVAASLRASASVLYTVSAGEWSAPAVTAEHPFCDEAAAEWRTVAQLTLASRLLLWPGEADVR